MVSYVNNRGNFCLKLHPRYTSPTNPWDSIREHHDRLSDSDKERLEELRGGVKGFESPVNNSHSNVRLPEREGLNILSWNIEYGLDLEKVINALKQHKSPDVIALQEVDKCTGRVSGVDIPDLLSQELEMHSSYAIEFYEVGRKKKGVTGNLVLSRHPLQSSGLFRFTNYFNWNLSPFEPRVGSRVANWVRISKGDVNYCIVNLHLENMTKPINRKKNVEEVMEWVDTDGSVLVMAGDFNTLKYWEPALNHLREQGLSGGTYHNTSTLAISRLMPFHFDHVFTTGNINDYVITDEGVSDHCSVSATINP